MVMYLSSSKDTLIFNIFWSMNIKNYTRIYKSCWGYAKTATKKNVAKTGLWAGI